MTHPAVGYLIRIELRRRGKSLLVLGFLVALVVATVVASLAGARRSATAFDRYLEGYRSPDAAVFGEPDARAETAELDAVDEAIDIELLAAVPAGLEYLPLYVAEGGAVPFERMHPPVVAGRYPVRDAPLELALSERTARYLGKGVGDTLTLDTYTQEAVEAGEKSGDRAPPRPDGPAVDLEVVGIVRDPGDIGARDTDLTFTFLTPAFRDAYPRDVVGALTEGTLIVLKDGYALSDVATAMADSQIDIDPSVSGASAYRQATPTMRSIATALRLFALVAALAGLIAIGQAAARLQTSASGDDGTLEALGATRVERWTRLAAPSSLAAVIGAVGGLGIALAASPMFPIGLARRADPELGFQVDLSAVAFGGAASIAVLTTLIGGIALWRIRRSSTDPRPGRVSRWGRVAADLGVAPSAVTGLTLASGTPGRPGRIAVGGTLLSVVGLLAALVFSASVDRLRTEPELYGWSFDAVIEGGEGDALGEEGSVRPRLEADGDVAALSTLYTQVPVRADGDPTYAAAIAEGAEALDPVMVRGEAPRGADEIAVGGDTLSSLGARLGDTIDLSLGDATNPVRITGVVALPVSADGGSAVEGVYLSPAGVTAFDVDRACTEDPNETCTRRIAVALRPGTDIEAFAVRYKDTEQDEEVALPRPPGEIDRLTAVEDLPRYMALFMAALAAAAISFATTATVRQRRRDLAVLRVLGMTGRHIRTVVVVMVLALTGFGAVLGGVLGIIVGRQVWRAVMGSVSLPFSPSLPVAAVVLVPIAVVVLAQLVATSSRRAAGRTPAAVVLRTE